MFHYITIVEITTQKGKHSCRYTELSLYRKEGIGMHVIGVGFSIQHVLMDFSKCQYVSRPDYYT